MTATLMQLLSPVLRDLLFPEVKSVNLMTGVTRREVLTVNDSSSDTRNETWGAAQKGGKSGSVRVGKTQAD